MSSGESASERPRRRGPTTSQVLVVTSVMFTFISYWRTAAIVLCDLASTAYYIGGIVESQIGKAAPWFILAVMLFSYAVRSVYIESCAMFVRGGVYRVVKEAMGGALAKLVGLGAAVRLHPDRADQRRLGRPVHRRPGSTISSSWAPSSLLHRLPEPGARRRSPSAITVYFWRVNIKGIHESSDQALKIMGATTVMGVVMIVWCLRHAGGAAREASSCRRSTPELSTARSTRSRTSRCSTRFGKQVDPLGFLGHTTARRGAAVGPDDRATG